MLCDPTADYNFGTDALPFPTAYNQSKPAPEIVFS